MLGNRIIHELCAKYFNSSPAIQQDRNSCPVEMKAPDGKNVFWLGSWTASINRLWINNKREKKTKKNVIHYVVAGNGVSPTLLLQRFKQR